MPEGAVVREEEEESGDAAGGRDKASGSDASEGLVGTGVARSEDRGLLTGRAEFVGDRVEHRMAHMAVVRSDHAHARVSKIDAGTSDVDAATSDVDAATSDAGPVPERDGVLAVYTWEDVAASDAPGVIPVRSEPLDHDVPGHPLLARDRVRYQGQPVAAVVAEDAPTARDAARDVTVEYEPLDAVVDPTDATAKGAPQLYDGVPDNVAVTTERGDRGAAGDAFEGAAHLVSLDLTNNRLQPTPLEPRAALSRWDADAERLTVRLTAMNPHGQRRSLAETLGLAVGDVRVVVPRVGGGFGQKNSSYPEDALTAWAAKRLGRPVKWVATRREHALAGNHARDHRTHAELALDGDYRFRGLRVETAANVGAYSLGGGAALAGNYATLLASQYDVPAIHCETRVVFTNTAPVHTYRGGTRPMAIYVTERIVDAAARDLGVDPAELRRRNLIGPDDFPHETAVGAAYDSGDYEPAMDVALDAVGYDELRTTDHDCRPETDDRGRYVGVGLASFVESSVGTMYECGVVRVHADGSVTVEVGTHSQGQGHATTYAQIVADELGVAFEDVTVEQGDTDRVPMGTGTFGSRSTLAGGNAVAESAREVREQARRIAAVRLDCELDAVADTGDGGFRGDGGGGRDQAEGDGSERSCSFVDVARTAYSHRLPAGVDAGLEATTFYDPGGDTYAFGTHAAVVSVDPETGSVAVERYVAVDDCGERINPVIVDGQIHGGVVQGIGQARTEHAVYDEDGTLLTDSMQAYGVPRAAGVPDVETHETVTPAPGNPLGVKGVGEAGTIAAPPAVVNAIVDALEPLGVRHLDMPVTDESVFRAIHGDP